MLLTVEEMNHVVEGGVILLSGNEGRITGSVANKKTASQQRLPPGNRS